MTDTQKALSILKKYINNIHKCTTEDDNVSSYIDNQKPFSFDIDFKNSISSIKNIIKDFDIGYRFSLQKGFYKDINYATATEHMTKIENITNVKYSNIFGSYLNDNNSKDFNILFNIIPHPFVDTFTLTYIRTNIFQGVTGSCTNLHSHAPTFNYLVYGLKLWILIKRTQKNTELINKYTEYGNIGSFLDNSNELLNKLDEIYIFYQYKNTCVHIPGGWYHGIINIEDSFCIASSYQPTNPPPLH
tara:strand:- start:1376 stop:2110 length:735 start_codon:yes stop_codon:yes gene_type:complete